MPYQPFVVALCLFALFLPLQPQVLGQTAVDSVEIFDGKTLAGWMEVGKEGAPTSWEVREGCIRCIGKPGGSLATIAEYGDFELTGEWKVSGGANSGILLRVPPGMRDAAAGGLEVQVIDESEGWKAVHGYGIGMDQSAGALYGFYPAIKSSIKKAGEWNTFRIIMNGARVAVWHNGETIADADMESDDWAKRLARSKFKNMKQFNKAASGQIVLQNYRGGEVFYRNLSLRPILDEESGEDAKDIEK